ERAEHRADEREHEVLRRERLREALKEVGDGLHVARSAGLGAGYERKTRRIGAQRTRRMSHPNGTTTTKVASATPALPSRLSAVSAASTSRSHAIPRSPRQPEIGRGVEGLERHH